MCIYEWLGKKEFANKKAIKLYGERPSSVEIIWQEIVVKEGSQEGY